ncbi:MAG: sulfatase-like hydrolase/transferase [Enterocloster asparagiformis]|nr:sulfatase-like hydrolase/transferase [Enterocloster asparagiformis]
MTKQQSRGGAELAQAVRAAYARGESDYYMEPLVRVDETGAPIGRIQDGDTVIFGCRRGEREIELTEMFTEPDFDKVERTALNDLQFVIMTLYHDKFRDLPIAFAPEQVQKPLAQVISEAGRTQLHAAESEKFAHVTFFFNGGNRTPYPGEEDIMVPSPKGVPFEDVPELSLSEVVDEVINRLEGPDFVVVNYANGDVIGHTSSNPAKIAAAGHMSRQLERLVGAAEARDFVVMITADHGNLESMITPSGKPDVAHTSTPVPFLLLDPRRENPVSPQNGSLCDVAPTVLHAMGIPQPPEMDGATLIPGVRFDEGRKVLLIILDGWGLGEASGRNPIFLADTPYWDFLLEAYPCAALNASGSFVGLGRDKAGNSEAGHLNLGAGRVVPQDDIRLDKAISDGSFDQNPVFLSALQRTRERGGALHILSYLTDKSSHGSIDYAKALCRMAKDLPVINLHIIFDGRSTEPGSAPRLLMELEEELERIGSGRIVDGVGRGIVLDRDQNYVKVKRGYDAMVLGQGTPYR